MSNKLTIMFAPLDGVGHVNACIGLAEVLLSRGHKIVFLTSKVYEGKLAPYGFHEELLQFELKKKNMKPGEHSADSLAMAGFLEPMSSFEKLKLGTKTTLLNDLIENTIEVEPQVKQIVAKHKPDLFIIDSFIGSPSLIYSDKPWVFLFSGNPLYVINDNKTPPGGSGYPTDGNNSSEECRLFRKVNDENFLKYNLIYNKWLKENGFPTINNKRMIPESPYLNIYGYPKELDYTDIRPLPPKWISVDAFMRKNEPGEFTLNEKMRNRDENEKLIYLSLGSVGSSNIALMKRLVQMLSKAPHKVIVSKGMLGDMYELADNMWGENNLPQTKVLPLVDLVITHGGNNTITETFSYGKPMIVMPLFGDQYDNAQRVHEKGFGLRIDGQTCTEEDLLEGIEELLNAHHLKKRLRATAKRLATSDSLNKACEAIEKLVMYESLNSATMLESTIISSLIPERNITLQMPNLSQ